MLDDFERDLSVNRLPLFGEIDGAHAAFSQQAQRAVRSEPAVDFRRGSQRAEALGSGVRARPTAWADTAIVQLPPTPQATRGRR